MLFTAGGSTFLAVFLTVFRASPDGTVNISFTESVEAMAFVAIITLLVGGKTAFNLSRGRKDILLDDASRILRF